ncbi:electron transfer flavoprotein [Mixta theicola]|uniref:Electron transfer flavoprotein n=1 Tax=Mixta theicola TaxID=1458355 RepID=A0A2K1Q7N8_9GAMM|nr:electron transfer flavoprotein [Mixta theicola]PNS11050.1 electron transfer flavoprotein [Mixta theicola]GLR08395.1 transporter [Mixta theicola]
MNILLAFKAEPDLGMLGEADWQAAAKSAKGPDPGLMRLVMGSDEQGAAELMLQAKARNAQLNLSAMTVGDARAMPLLRHLAALGFTQRTLVNTARDLRFNPAFIARQIAERVRQEKIAMVLLGSQSSEGQNGQTGWLLADILGWPCFSGVTGLEARENGFTVQSDDFHQRSQWQLAQPAVLMVQNRGQMALRVPGMRARLAAAQADVMQIAPAGEAHPTAVCSSLAREVSRRAGEVIVADSVQEKVQKLWDRYLSGRMSR